MGSVLMLKVKVWPAPLSMPGNSHERFSSSCLAAYFSFPIDNIRQRYFMISGIKAIK